MGVRFQCPQGHNLHVKVELAGKRGLCPECGVKFVVPAFSGERVAACVDDPSAASGVAQSANGSAVLPGAMGAQLVGGAAKPQAAGEGVAWYVRPAAGGQFGPAPSEVFQQWIGEGRVAADSWVWRTGWPEWRAGSELLQRGPKPIRDEPAFAATVGAIAVVDDALPADLNAVAAQVDFGPAQTHRAELRRRQQRTRTISLMLGIAALAMIVVLIVVLAR